MENRER